MASDAPPAPAPAPAAAHPRTSSGGNPHLAAVYALGLSGAPSDLKGIYDEWASSYDADLALPAQGYVGPSVAARALARTGVPVGASVLDAGCGTGLVGAALRALGYGTVDGVDLSDGMLARAAATRAYRALRAADLTQRLPIPDAAYDAVTCVGTLTLGHVGPAALDELARVTRPGGVVVATVLDDVWAAGGYDAHVARMHKAGKVDVLGTDLEPYRAGAGVEARTLVLRVIGVPN